MKTITYSIQTLSILMLFLFPFTGFTQSKSEFNHSKEIITYQPATSKVVGNQRVETGTGIVRAVYSLDFAVDNDKPELMARQYLSAHALALLLKSDIDDLEHERTIETPGGYRVHFMQKAEGYPVYDATINVSINRHNKVVFVSNTYQPVGKLQTAINTTSEAALLTAKNHIGITGKLSFEKVETVVYNIDFSKSVIAYKVNLVPAEDHFGDWELIIDAGTGIILRAEDKACYYRPLSDTVDGSGRVFDPDPVTNAKTLYGATGFTDNDDADSDSLTAQLKTVTLKDISFDGSVYRLEGPYAAIADFEVPYTGLYEQSSSYFHYTRSNEAFEAVNAYYHIDKSMRYMNDTLGFDVMPIQYEGGVQYDPHGLNGGNNAYYRSLGKVVFGSPANSVDLAEDHTTIIHEIGHGLHDWITNGGLSQVDGLGEGLADYWAQSYTRSLGKFEPGDEAYDYVFVWGGFPIWTPPNLRVTNFDGHYPEDKDGEVHYSGQLWSSSLMSIYDSIGREATDMNCWEGISMLNKNSSQVDAAYAFSQADKDLYDGEHLEQIYDVFYERGYLPGPVVPFFTADQTNGEGPREVVFTNATFSFLDDIVSWEWDFNNDGEIDSYEQNPTYTFTEVGAYTISLTVSDGEFFETLEKKNYITVNGGFFVFEASENKKDYSGTFIRDFLEARGYDVIYSNYYPDSLAGFDAVFLSFGNADVGLDKATLLSYSYSLTIQRYLEEGGTLYTEASPFLAVPGYYNYPNADEFIALFGVEAVTTTATTPPNPISQLAGLDGTLTEGMVFTSSNQQFNGYIDKIVPAEGATISFYEEDYDSVSIYSEGDFGQKTFHFAYSLAELVDEDPHSSRYNILLKVLEFFGYPEGEGYLVANFTADQNEVEVDVAIQFTDWSLVDEGYEIAGWAWDFDEDGEIDSYEQNPVWTYSEGGIFNVTLVVTGNADTDTLVKNDFITVRSGILVYEGRENEDAYSGTFIRNYMESHGYDEVTYTNNFPTSLKGYNAVFLSFGNTGLRSTAVTQEMSDAIFNYAIAGGSIYMEGGDAMYLLYDSYLWVFGLQSVDEGELSNEIVDLAGQEGAITQGMQFTASSQLSVRSIDKYSKKEDFPESKAAFLESDYGTVAVEFDGILLNGQKTFCMSYALADLQDGDGINTRNELLKRILDFFNVTVGVEEQTIEESAVQLRVFPNPAKEQLTLEFSLERNLPVLIEVFDLSGRRISVTNTNCPEGIQRISYNVNGYSPGIYYIRLRAGDKVETIKWVKMQ